MEGIITTAFLILLFAFIVIVFSKSKGGNFKFIWKFKQTPEEIGREGENEVIKALGKNIENEKYVINNMIVIGKNGRTSQIDHILINSNGIFVIETKSHAGRIYGQANQREWTQVLAMGDVKHKMYNPIKQNATHLYNVKEILGNSYPIYSMVVFVNADILNVNAENVYNIPSMEYHINRPREKQLTAEQINRAYEILCQAKEKNNVSDEEHIKNIEKLQEDISNHICPRCGAKLVERNGRNGLFLGCSNFPKCKYTKPWEYIPQPKDELLNDINSSQSELPEREELITEISTNEEKLPTKEDLLEEIKTEELFEAVNVKESVSEE